MAKIGFNSGGVHLTCVGPRGRSKYTPAYAKWTDMMARCYLPSLQARNPTYRGCTVEAEWHDFQVFAEWFYSQDQYADNLQLDKDILTENNKVYGAETCCLVPQRINLLTVRKGAKTRGPLPVGVSLQTSGGNYMAKYRREGVQTYLGTFKTKEEAFDKYKQAKEAYIKFLVEGEYSQILPVKIRNALLNYKVLITD